MTSFQPTAASKCNYGSCFDERFVQVFGFRVFSAHKTRKKVGLFHRDVIALLVQLKISC